MKINNKNTKFIENIQLEIQDKVFDFYGKFNKMPRAIALGPTEYVSLLVALKPEQDAMAIVNLDTKIRLWGVPVYAKQTSGVDIIIPSSLIPKIAIGALVDKE